LFILRRCLLEFKKQKRGTETQFFAYSVSRSELKAKQEELRSSKDTAAIAKNQADLQKNNQALSQLFESTNPPLTGVYLKDAYGEPTQGLPQGNIYGCTGTLPPVQCVAPILTAID
jgi:hypothetical protein